MIKNFQLPNELIESINFSDLYSLRPDKRSKIILYDKDTKDFRDREIFRSYMSYMNTPEFNTDIKKSYMFVNKSNSVPEQLEKVLKYVKDIDSRYNQMVINWYEPEEYIELHRDCTSSMISEDAEILMINFNETNSLYDMRTFHIVSLDNLEISSTPLRNGYVYIIDNNKTHRHFTGKGTEKRISITFRMMKEV